ncbi:MAG: ABC transporter ATP-binding protein [Acidimicrobiia bacterium]
MTDESLVRGDQLARTFGSGRAAVVALHGATCEIHAGERIAIMGPSGSGKSTLLHLIAGLDTPTAGSITWPALGARATLRPGPIALVLQGPSLLPPLDVTENVALPLILGGSPSDTASEHAREALARLGLLELADKLPEELSGGQAQRVAIARAVAQRPRLLLADEPTGQLDHATAAQVIDVLLDAAEQSGAALVVSTHDPEVGDRLALRWSVNDGRLSTDPAHQAREASCSA